MIQTPINQNQSAGAWHARDCSRKSFEVQIEPRHLDAFDQLLESLGSINAEDIQPAHIDLSHIKTDLDHWCDRIRNGTGLVILCEFPLDRYSEDQLARIHWAIGLQLGTPMSQSTMGDRLGHVVGIGGKDYSERAYRSRVELDMHTDACDIVGMLCLQKAQSGGVSGYVSAVSIYNEIMQQRPELLPFLTRGFYYHRFGEQAPDESPVTKNRLPVFSLQDGYLTVHYLRAFIEFACQERGVSLSDEEAEALDLFDTIAHSEEFALSFITEPGEAVYFNNRTVLHSRTAFDDAPEPQLKRHFLRLWLVAHDPLPKSDLLKSHERQGIPKQEKGRLRFEHSFNFKGRS